MAKKQVTRRGVVRQRSSSTSGIAKKDVVEDEIESSSSKESDSESEVLDKSKVKQTPNKQRKSQGASKISSTVTASDNNEKQSQSSFGVKSPTQQCWISLQRLLLVCIIGFGTFYLFGDGSQGRDRIPSRFERPSRLQVDLDWLSPEARFALETFHDELSTLARGDRRARVLQLESTPEYVNRLHQLIDLAFPQTEFYRLTKDAAWGRAELESTYLDGADDVKPFVIIVWNSHKASMNTLLTYAHELSADHFGTGPTRRSAGNTGFLFIGHSLPTGKACQQTDLLTHDVEVLGWIHTFITRLTNYAKVC